MAVLGTEFRKGFILLSLIGIVYISLTAYKMNSVAELFQSGVHLLQNETRNYAQQFINSAQKKNPSQKWWSDRNFTVISREFFQYLASQLRGTPYPGAKNYTNYIVAQSWLKPLPGVVPLRPDFGPVLNDVTSFRYPIEIKSCRQDDKIRRTNASGLFVAVISAPDHFDKRNLIRQTWLRQLEQKKSNRSVILTGHGFILGLTKDLKIQERIKVESDKFNDILQIDMIDHYFNLTLKDVGLLNWLNKDHCRADFVLKVDDDIFVNVRNLISSMKPLHPPEKSLYGSETDDRPQREGKFKVSLENWPWIKYPIYVSGGGMIISGSAISSLLAAAQTTPYFAFEDTYLTGLCTGKAGIKVRCSPSFFVMFDYGDAPEPCHVRNSVSWLTDSAEHFNKSYWATRDFYNNVTQCIFQQGPDGETQTADPTEMIHFPFSK